MPSARVSIERRNQSLYITERVSRDIWARRGFLGDSMGAFEKESWGPSEPSPSPDVSCLSSSNFWDASVSVLESATSHLSLKEIMNIMFMIPMPT